MPIANIKKLKAGARVKYSRAFLRSISAFTGPMSFARGVIESVRETDSHWRIATVRWDAGREAMPTEINVVNLVPEKLRESE